MSDMSNLAPPENSDVSRSREHGPTDLDVPHLIVRLIQCQHCSHPLDAPLRLPCGNTVCRTCLPPVRPRTGITYPVSEGREQGFTCYWEGTNNCVGEHCVGDCGVDVVLCNIVGIFQEELAWDIPVAESNDEEESQDQQAKVRVVRWKVQQPATKSPELHSADITQSGWLQGLYLLAWEGRLPHSAYDIVYEEPRPSHGSAEQACSTKQDCVRFQKLRDRLRNELDCQVCYSLILDPLTTPCGHTFCRKCVARVLDHADLCPICRRKVGMPAAIQSEPLNNILVRLIDHFFADQVTARREALAEEELGGDGEKSLPLFVCTLSFPTMPTFLHIFEPRYRLMIRRVVDSGDGKFGMVMYNRRGRAQSDDLGSVPFMQYGTLLMVERYELLPDGRSLVIATGVSRFKVLEAGELDGYHIAKTERVDDISLAEEERLEATETAASAIPDPTQAADAEPSLESMSTQDLLSLTRDFIRRQRQAGAPWLHPRVMLAYGPVPTDAARFPWWFASILPIAEEEKYPILSAISVRERLKISAKWARELEARDWYVVL
jgi:Lon protease-like protein